MGLIIMGLIKPLCKNDLEEALLSPHVDHRSSLKGKGRVGWGGRVLFSAPNLVLSRDWMALIKYLSRHKHMGKYIRTMYI